MPVFTGATLLAEVRDYADQPDDGQGSLAYVTDDQIRSRLTSEYRKVIRTVARKGVFFGKTSASFAAAPSVTLASVPMVIFAVYHEPSSTVRNPLRKVVDGVDPLITGNVPVYWEPSLTLAGSATVAIYPTPTVGNIRVVYAPEPSTIASAGTLYLTEAMKDAVVMGAALRCYAKEEGNNSLLRALYTDAVAEVEADAAQYSGDTVVRNVDDIYPPGDDQGGSMIYDPADFWWAP